MRAIKNYTVKQYFINISPVQQLLLLIIITLASWLVITILGIAVAILFWGSGALMDPNALMANSAFLKFFQIFQGVGLFILPPLLYELLTSGSMIPGYRSLKNRTGIYILISVGVVIASQPLITFLGVFNNGLILPDYFSGIEEWMRETELAAKEITELFLASSHWSQYIINVIIIAVLPAIGEELMFRGALQKIFQSAFKNAHWAVFVTAVLFSAIHVQFFGFLPRFVLGLIFGYLMVYSGNIWLPILAHFTNNFMAFVMYQWYVSDSPTGVNPLEAGNEYPDAIWVVTSVVAIIITLVLCKRLNKASVANHT